MSNTNDDARSEVNEDDVSAGSDPELQHPSQVQGNTTVFWIICGIAIVVFLILFIVLLHWSRTFSNAYVFALMSFIVSITVLFTGILRTAGVFRSKQGTLAGAGAVFLVYLVTVTGLNVVFEGGAQVMADRLRDIVEESHPTDQTRSYEEIGEVIKDELASWHRREAKTDLDLELYLDNTRLRGGSEESRLLKIVMESETEVRFAELTGTGTVYKLPFEFTRDGGITLDSSFLLVALRFKYLDSEPRLSLWMTKTKERETSNEPPALPISF